MNIKFVSTNLQNELKIIAINVKVKLHKYCNYKIIEMFHNK